MKRLKTTLRSNYLYYTFLLLFLIILTLNQIIFLPFVFVYYIIFNKQINKPLSVILILLIVILFIYNKNTKLKENINDKVLITDKQQYYNNYTYTIKYKNKKYLFNNYNNFKIGDYLYINADIEPFRDLSSPNGFKESTYYLEKGIYAKLKINSLNQINKYNYFYMFNNKIFNSNLSFYLKTSNNYELDQSINNLNLFYLLSLSGIHIHFLINLTKKSMYYLDINNNTQDVIIIIFTIFLIMISGFYYSIIRIGIYLIFKIIKKHVYPNITNYSLMNGSYLITLFIFPFLMSSISYLISYLLVSFIFLFKNKITSSSYIISNIKLSFLVNLILIPFSNKLNIISIILNPLFIFIFIKIIFPLEILFYLFNLNKIKALNDTLTNIVGEIGKSNFNILLPKLNIYLIIIYFILLITLYSINKHKLINLFLLITITIIPIFKKYFYDSKLYFLDVGQGDSSVYISKDTVIVVDAFKSVSRLLLYEGIYKIDYLIITHDHLDHTNEANYLISNYKVNNIILNDYDNYNINSMNIIYITEYIIIEINEVKLEFFYINESVSGSNNNSLIFKMYYNDTSILFTGDIEYEAELLLYQIYERRLKSDILKVAHHGSKTSSDFKLLNKIQPTISIISAGYKNKYDMPHEKVLNNLAKVGSRVYRTDLNGTILYYNNNIHLI